MGDPDKITLDVAGLLKDDFLQQNGYSDYDQFCPLWKTEYMMKAFMGFQSQLRSMKFEVPTEGEEKISKKASVPPPSPLKAIADR